MKREGAHNSYRRKSLRYVLRVDVEVPRDNHTSAWRRWRPAAAPFLLFGLARRGGELVGIERSDEATDINASKNAEMQTYDDVDPLRRDVGAGLVAVGSGGEYTRGLLASLPKVDAHADKLLPIEGTPPSLRARSPGCAFHPRCPHARARCSSEEPALRGVGPVRTACHFAEALDAEAERRAEEDRAVERTVGNRA